MKTIQRCIIGVLTFIFLILLSINSFAAQGSFTISKTSVSLTEGGSTTFSIQATNCEGQFTISSSNSGVVKVSSSSVWVTGSESITLTAVKAGTAKITITASNVGDTSENEVTGSKTISVTVKAKATSGGSSGGSTTPEKPTFTSTNQTVYAKGDINLRSSWSTSSTATLVSEGTEMTLTGTSSKYVNGYIWSRVSYKGATKYVASNLITTTKPASKSDTEKKEDEKKETTETKTDDSKVANTNLKSLTVMPTGLSPVFAASTTEYTMTVGSNIDKIDVKAVTEDSKASVKVEGNEDLEIGNNTITITVTSGKETKTYRIVVTKENENQLQLSELLIEGLPLSPAFNTNIYEYTLTLDRSDISEINITATPSKKDAEIEIVGNTNLVAGENIVTILVKSKDGEQITTYQITVTLPQAPNVVEKNNKDLYMYIGIGVGVLFLIIIIIVIARGRNNEEDEDINLDELPKLDGEDLPKSLRKETNLNKESNVNSNIEEDNSIKETANVTSQNSRDKKIDEFYNNADDEQKTRRKGRHSK